MLDRRQLLLSLAALGLSAPAAAQTYPARVIRMVTPFTAGSPVDVAARLLAQHLSARLGQEVIVDNRPGAGTITGMKAAALALQEHPQFNASLDPAAGELILKRYCHLGVAAATERGLIVPVIRDVDKKPVLEVARELGALAQRVREGKATLDELRGGTFTVTNIGALGGTGAIPIINYPEVAILAVARGRVGGSPRAAHLRPRRARGGVAAGRAAVRSRLARAGPRGQARPADDDRLPDDVERALLGRRPAGGDLVREA